MPIKIRSPKRFFTLWVLLLLFNLLQLHFSIGRVLSLETGFFLEHSLFLILSSFTIATVLSFMALIKVKWLKNLVALLVCASTWFYTDYIFFVERESAFSSYTLVEEIQAVIQLSYIPIFILWCIFYFVLQLLQKIPKPFVFEDLQKI